MSQRSDSLYTGRCTLRRYAMVDAWHPGVMLAYVVLIVIVACSMPATPFLAASLFGGMVLLVQVEGARGARTVAAALVLGCAVMLLAPIFDTAGSTVLFAYLGRPYTAEALMRGLVTGLLVAAMLVWFACLFRIVSGEGLLQVCGSVAPRIGMVTSLVVQLVPRLSRRAARVRTARIGAGLAPMDEGMIAKLHETTAVFATVATDSLERSVVCADAMESRGYGTGARTNGSLESFTKDERVFSAMAIALTLAFAGASLVHAASGESAPLIVSVAVYGALCLLAVLFNVAEDVRWRI